MYLFLAANVLTQMALAADATPASAPADTKTADTKTADTNTADTNTADTKTATKADAKVSAGSTLEVVIREEGGVRVARPTGPVPANTAFRVVINGQDLAGGKLRIWRETNATCHAWAGAERPEVSAVPKKDLAKELDALSSLQEVALLASSDGTSLAGHVSPLPSSQAYCIAVDVERAFPKALWDIKRRVIAERLVANFISSCEEDAVKASLAGAHATLTGTTATWRLEDTGMANELPEHAPALERLCTAHKATAEAYTFVSKGAPTVTVGATLAKVTAANPGLTVAARTGPPVAWKDLVANAGKIDPATLEKVAVDTVVKAAAAGDKVAVAREVKALAAELTAWQAHLAKVDAANAEVAKAREAMVTYAAAALPAKAISTGYLSASGSGASASPVESSQKGSYFTPIVGFGGAYATGGTAEDWWAVPYAGANVYFAPIDREVPLDDLGSTLFRRRFGVTIGVALYKPVTDVPGRRDLGLLGDDVTLIGGVTMRATRFVNLTAFAVPYKVAVDNPLADHERIATAIGLAASFDADVWSAVTAIKP